MLKRLLAGVAGLAAVVGGVVLTSRLMVASGRWKPLGPEHAAYEGLWKGRGGERLRIYSDGSADYRAGLISCHECGVQFEGATLQLDRGLGAHTNLAITAPPHEADGGRLMALDGVEYARQGK